MTAPIRRSILRLSTARNWSQIATVWAPMEGTATTIGSATFGELDQGNDADRPAHGIDRIDGEYEARGSAAMLTAGGGLEIDPIDAPSLIWLRLPAGYARKKRSRVLF